MAAETNLRMDRLLASAQRHGLRWEFSRDVVGCAVVYRRNGETMLTMHTTGRGAVRVYKRTATGGQVQITQRDAFGAIVGESL